MAGLGRKVWTRETLSSAELQGYLQDQVVMRFPSAVARQTDLPAPTEGMISTLDDVDTVSRYNGTAWVVIAHGITQSVRGSYGGATDASGNVVVSHTLGATPGQVFVTPLGGAVQHLVKPVVTAKSSTQFTVTTYRTDNSGLLTGNPAPFDWQAWR